MKKILNIAYQNFAATAQINNFTHFSVPLTFLNGTSIKSFHLSTMNDAYGQTIFLDNVYLSAPQSNTTVIFLTTPYSNFSNNLSIQSRGNISANLPDKLLIGLILNSPNPT